MKTMLANGLWPYLKQRPLDKIANPAVTPKAIFISSFDSSPLAPDYDFIIRGQDQYFQHGLNALAKLTDGKVNLTRSEERRVGKECRSRWSRYQSKKKEWRENSGCAR